jgi:hypothetical protein
VKIQSHPCGLNEFCHHTKVKWREDHENNRYLTRVCILQHTQMLGTVIVPHRGFIVIVESAGPSSGDGQLIPTDLTTEEQLDGGANALNVNRSSLSLMQLFKAMKLS